MFAEKEKDKRPSHTAPQQEATRDWRKSKDSCPLLALILTAAMKARVISLTYCLLLFLATAEGDPRGSRPDEASAPRALKKKWRYSEAGQDAMKKSTDMFKKYDQDIKKMNKRINDMEKDQKGDKDGLKQANIALEKERKALAVL